MLKIRQSYHGTGGKEGYVYEVYDDEIKLGNLDNVPVRTTRGDVVKINKRYYQINKHYDCPLPESEHNEVVWYELDEFEFKEDYDLGEIK